MIEQSNFKKLRVFKLWLLGMVTFTKAMRMQLQLDSGAFVTMSRRALYRLFNQATGNILLLTSAYTLKEEDNGKTIIFNSATGFIVTLPSHAFFVDGSSYIGYSFKFIVGTAPTSGNHVVLSAVLDDITGPLYDLAGTGDAASSADQINFVANQAVTGDWVECDGAGGLFWIVRGGAAVAAGITATG